MATVKKENSVRTK